MMTETEMITKAIETIRNATTELNKAVSTRLYSLEIEAKALDKGLDSLLEELVNAHDDKNDHFKRFEKEKGADWEKQSLECKQDWSRAHSRFERAVYELTKYAQAIQKAKKSAA
jgi:hypothetical protein